MRLSIRIALRFLYSNKVQTLFIALGIAIGISVQIFIGALIEGLQSDLIEATIGNAPHLTITNSNRNQPLSNIDALLSEINLNTPEQIALTPSITQGGFIQYDSNYIQVVFKGFPIREANEIYHFTNNLEAQSILPKGNEVLIGKKIATENNIQIGNTIELITPDGKALAVVVSGIFDLKVETLNQTWVIGNLSLAQVLFEYDEDSASAIEMQVLQPFEIESTKDRLQTSEPFKGLKLLSWKQANEQLLSGLTGQSTSSYMIQFFVILSVVLGISSVLAITVLQKSKQIGILKAMGITDFNASLVFLFQGLFLGVLGGMIGIVFGIGLLYAFESFALSSDGSPVVSVTINPNFMIFSGILAIIACTIASLVPARKSKKLSPIEVIRNG